MRYLIILMVAVVMAGCAGSQPPVFDGKTLTQTGNRCYKLTFPEIVDLRVSFVEQNTTGEPTSFENTRLESKNYGIKISHGLIEGGSFRSKFSPVAFQWVKDENVLYKSDTRDNGDYAAYVVEWRPEGTRKMLRANLIAYGANGKQVMNLYLFRNLKDSESKETAISSDEFKEMIQYMTHIRDGLSMKCDNKAAE